MDESNATGKFCIIIFSKFKKIQKSLYILNINLDAERILERWWKNLLAQNLEEILKDFNWQPNMKWSIFSYLHVPLCLPVLIIRGVSVSLL